MGLKARIGHEEPSGTHGGDATSGAWRQRTLNTEFSDPDNIVTISANEFTLQAGTYVVKVGSLSWRTNRNQTVLYDVTGSTIIAAGSSEYASTNQVVSENILFHAFTIESANTYSIQSQVQVDRAVTGFGPGNSFGAPNAFVEVEIEKLTAAEEVAIICDEKGYTADGGDFNATVWRTHDINTNRFDPQVLVVSISANEFILQPGTYVLEAAAAGFSVNAHKIRLQNITDNTTIGYGSNETDSPTYASQSNSLMFAEFTLLGTKVLSLESRCVTTKTVSGFGVANDFDATVPSVYAQVLVRRVPAPTPASYAIITDHKTAGIVGGQLLVGAWRQRDLNTEVYDPDGIVTVSANAFTLVAGSYWIEATMPVSEVDSCLSRLVNSDGDVVEGTGGSVYADRKSVV